MNIGMNYGLNSLPTSDLSFGNPYVTGGGSFGAGPLSNLDAMSNYGSMAGFQSPTANMGSLFNAGTGGNAGGFNFNSLFGETGKNVLGAVGTLGNLFMGMQQYGLAKDAFNLQKQNYERNYQAQRQTTNSRMEDRQRARVASNPGAYEDVGSYMDRNQVR